ncbi:MAG: hypothetical protein K8T20_09215 [Planctomycetes bacterium]|nr:hypothetical protein [Planctomycetota bacterium]
MRTLLHKVIFVATLAALLAVAWGPVASAEDKKDGKPDKKAGDKEKTDKEREEEKKRKEEEAKRREREAAENWDKREGDDLGWPEPPDIGEMMDAAKHRGDAAPAGCSETEPKPGVGGYRKPPTDEDAAAAEAAGGAFGEGAGEHGSSGGGDAGKDEKKDDHK